MKHYSLLNLHNTSNPEALESSNPTEHKIFGQHVKLSGKQKPEFVVRCVPTENKRQLHKAKKPNLYNL
jgi:hypothetical protein